MFTFIGLIMYVSYKVTIAMVKNIIENSKK